MSKPVEELKSSEKEFWEAQDKLLRVLQGRKVTGSHFVSAPIVAHDYPPIYSKKDFASSFKEVLEDYYLNGTGESQSQVGDSFIVSVENAKGIAPKERAKEILESPWATQIEETPTGHLEVTASVGMEVWTIIQPTHLYPLSRGKNKWDSERWKPRVWSSQHQKWIDASPIDCENWSKIPENKKRVNLCVCIILGE